MSQKRVVVFLMILVHLALIGEEITLHQVVCIKNNYTSDIEFAVVNYLCQCDYQQNESAQPWRKGIHTRNKCCYDIPLSTSLFERNSVSNYKNIHIIKLICLLEDGDENLNQQITNSRKLYRDFRVTKFLQTPLSLLSSTILRQ